MLLSPLWKYVTRRFHYSHSIDKEIFLPCWKSGLIFFQTLQHGKRLWFWNLDRVQQNLPKQAAYFAPLNSTNSSLEMRLTLYLCTPVRRIPSYDDYVARLSILKIWFCLGTGEKGAKKQNKTPSQTVWKKCIYRNTNDNYRCHWQNVMTLNAFFSFFSWEKCMIVLQWYHVGFSKCCIYFCWKLCQQSSPMTMTREICSSGAIQ